MSGFEVSTPILNGPFDEPEQHWLLQEGVPPVQQPGRRSAGYYFRDPGRGVQDGGGSRGVWREMPLVNLIRDRVREWRLAGRPGITGVTAELFLWWEREGRHPRLFFAQREAVETVVFLTEARQDFLQGIAIPRDEPSEARIGEGYAGFERRCAKMATGSGKSTVAAMLAAWSILNKVADRSDKRFSDTVLIVCPNVTIRRRLNELDPAEGEASLYRVRDLVPESMMPDLMHGRVIITNWHVFEPQTPGGGGARVVKAGVPKATTERITVGARTTAAHGSRHYTHEAYDAARAAGELDVKAEALDATGAVIKAEVRATRYVESDSALVNRILDRTGGKQNILVINDEAHHAYRIPPEEADDEDGTADGAGNSGSETEDKDAEKADRKQATVWIDGLDKVNKVRGINLCVDLSATPYYLGRMGDATNTVFPWVVSDFGLTDAIESGLVKVPQLVAQDDTGAAMPAFFNIWAWILTKLTPQERGAARASPDANAILKWAHTPIAILGGMWAKERESWAEGDDKRPPVLILVAKNKKIAKALFEWIGEGSASPGVAPLSIPGLRNEDGRVNTIRVDTSVVAETDSDNAKLDDNRWMRLTLDTVGSTAWPVDKQNRPIYPEGFQELAAKLHRPLHPPGRDIRCIVSVGMLTEGWDCNTVTHVIGLRPFQSQLLCEQVVGRALRRRSYQIGNDGKFEEEVAKVFGVPFEVVPFKASNATPKPKPPHQRIYPVPAKARHAITLPNVVGYQMAVRDRIAVADWTTVPTIKLDPMDLPPTSALAATLNVTRPSVNAPGGVAVASLAAFRERHREQELAFQMAADLTRLYAGQPTCEVPVHVLFGQVLKIVRRYIAEKVKPLPPADRLDAFLSPYYGWIIERLLGAIRPDAEAGETPEVPEIDEDRPLRTADISVFTIKPVREVVRSHVNLCVFDTLKWEESAAYILDQHPTVRSFVKNVGLSFTIPYLHNGKLSGYMPDFMVRLEAEDERYLIVEIKGADREGTAEVKAQAAHRWCAAVNATKRFGHWEYCLVYEVPDLLPRLDSLQIPEMAI
ncbi:BPTD_3080 family restriction endonuclease [Rhodopila sp.]|uniref:BPTD_3080 family restriction endonuclease n=1 Tax=Rhodopila sp. TaxID=2480087 RepID=UPI003D114660